MRGCCWKFMSCQLRLTRPRLTSSAFCWASSSFCCCRILSFLPCCCCRDTNLFDNNFHYKLLCIQEMHRQVNVLPHTRRSTCSVRSAGFSARPVNGQTGAMHDLLPHLPGKGFLASSGKSHILSVQLIFGHVAPQQLLLQLQHGVLLHGQALLQSILMRGRERRVH